MAKKYIYIKIEKKKQQKGYYIPSKSQQYALFKAKDVMFDNSLFKNLPIL